MFRSLTNLTSPFGLVCAALLVTLAGCGAVHTPTAAVRAGHAQVAAATATWVITAGTLVEGPTPMPGHDYPVSEDYTFEIQAGAKSFTLVINAVNPGGNLFIPRVAQALRDGVLVAPADYLALGKALQGATTAPGVADPNRAAAALISTAPRAK